jgi:hypothetical protein
MSEAALTLIEEAKRHGVRLIPTAAGTIKAFAPTPPPVDLLTKLKSRRNELFAVLTESREQLGAAVDIAKPRDGIPHEWAEGFLRLDAARPPADVPPIRWRRFIDDCGRFLDGWAATAHALGWNAIDLFGCNDLKPFARVDQAGLLWLLDGNRLIGLTNQTAAIAPRSGARQTYPRRPRQPTQVLAWDIAGPTTGDR